MTNVRGQYPPEFTLRAGATLTAQGRSVADVARPRGVSASRLREWKKAVRETGTAAFPGPPPRPRWRGATAACGPR